MVWLNQETQANDYVRKCYTENTLLCIISYLLQRKAQPARHIRRQYYSRAVGGAEELHPVLRRPGRKEAATVDVYYAKHD